MKHSPALRGALVVGLLFVGCSSNTATKDDIARLEAQIGEVRRTAEESLNTANEARQVAQEGDARTRRMEEAVNRSFQKSMYK